MQLFLLLCVCPDFLLGPITVLAVRHINRALLTQLGSLSPEQQYRRRAVRDTMVQKTMIEGGLTLANGATCLWLTCDVQARQTGLPYYAFIWHYGVFALICLRLASVRAPHPISIVCPLPVRGGAANADDVQTLSLSVSSPSAGHSRQNNAETALHTSYVGVKKLRGGVRLPKLIGARSSLSPIESVTTVEPDEQSSEASHCITAGR